MSILSNDEETYQFLFQNIEQKNSRAATNTFYFYPWITLFGFLADWTGFLY